MGRELRRKQAKKEGKSLKVDSNKIEHKEIIKFLKIVLLLIFIISVIYILSALFVTKEVNWFNKEKKVTETNKVTNSILASSIFKQKEEEYYVYFYDFDETKTDLTTEIINKLSSETLYKVDTKSAMNSNYVSNQSNKNAKKLDDLKVVSPTLIKISGDTITEYYEKDEIITNLK